MKGKKILFIESVVSIILGPCPQITRYTCEGIGTRHCNSQGSSERDSSVQSHLDLLIQRSAVDVSIACGSDVARADGSLERGDQGHLRSRHSTQP